MTALLSAGLRFALVGLANTLFGMVVIATMLAAGFGDYTANLCGYSLGLTLSFTLNRTWTFGIRGSIEWREGAMFLLAVMLSYLANLSLLYTMRILGYRESLIGQAAAMLAYSACFFLFSRRFVFGDRGGAS